MARGSDEFVVREHFAEEAPRVVCLCDRRPSMALFPEGWPWLRKPEAIEHTVKLIADSAIAARGLLGYYDEAGGAPSWHPPRSQHVLAGVESDRPFTAERTRSPVASAISPNSAETSRGERFSSSSRTFSRSPRETSGCTRSSAGSRSCR